MQPKLLVEAIGTFFLVFVIALSGNPLAIGLVLMVMVYMGGHISGAHYNPAVSLALWLRGKIPTGLMVQYRFAQLCGAFVAALLAFWLTDKALVPMPHADISAIQAVVVEAIFTFALALTVISVAASKSTAGNQYYGLAIGATIIAAAFAGGPLSGGAFNPAVGVGPLLLSAFRGGAFMHGWIYIIGPFLGGRLAAQVAHKVMRE